MRFLCVLVAVGALLGCGVATDPVDSVKDVVTRLIGAEAAGKFSLTLTADPDEQFVLHASPADAPVISASTPVALATGVMTYLKTYAHCDITWSVNRTADQVQLPATLPAIPATKTVSALVPLRYYQNVCTVSYSMAWWDWTRWEREIDWMALSGINAPLAFTGSEYAFAQVFTSMGFTETELEAHFGGAAFLAWARMGNVRGGWEGALTPAFREAQHQLQLKILARLTELQMIPVLPGFGGHVPRSITTLFPNASVQESPNWGSMPPEYCCVSLLNPNDPLFKTIGKKLGEVQMQLYGNVTRYYNADTFNEMNPDSSDPAYLKATAAAVYDSLPDNAVWVMQGWAFHSGFWKDDALKAYLSGAPEDNLVILDLNSEESPLWQRFVDQGPRKFVWNMLHNYGGARSLYGQVDKISTEPQATLKSAPAGLMVGMGITMEAIEQNPVMYELMMEQAWTTRIASSDDWLTDYAMRRYGGSSPSAARAWDLLHSCCYDAGFSWNGQSVIVKRPALTSSTNTSPNTTELTQAWRMIVAAAGELPSVTGGYHYDLVDITRQSMSNLFFDLLQSLNAAFATCQGALTRSYTKFPDTDNPGQDLHQVGDCGILRTPPVPCNITMLEDACDAIANCEGFNSNGYLKSGDTHHEASKGTDFYARQRAPSNWDVCSPSVDAISTAMKDMLVDFDNILGTDVNYLLGVWIQTARSWGGGDAAAADVMEANARNQVTLWGPEGEIDDYAAKNWAGLVSGYYVNRWNVLFDTLAGAIKNKQAPDWTTMDATLLKLGQTFCNETDPNATTFPIKPSGKDAVAMSKSFLAKYATMAPGSFTRKDGMAAPGSDAAFNAWTKDVGELAYLCSVNPTCKGFGSDGTLLTSVDNLVPTTGAAVYVKA